jgi:small subunit ribosomal protein S16
LGFASTQLAGDAYALCVAGLFLYQSLTVSYISATVALTMLMIRFQRIGRKNDPAFRIVVLEKTSGPKAGKYVELVGTYNPKTKAANIQGDKIEAWVAKGAQVSDSVHNLLVKQGIRTGDKIAVITKKNLEKHIAKRAAEEATAKAAVEAKAAKEAADAAKAAEEAKATAAAEAAAATPAEETAVAEAPVEKVATLAEEVPVEAAA